MMPNLDPAWAEILKYGVVSAFLVLSMALNVYLWRIYRAAVADLLTAIEQHEDEKDALYDRFIASRDTLLEKYNTYLRQTDKTWGDILRVLNSRGGRGG